MRGIYAAAGFPVGMTAFCCGAHATAARQTAGVSLGKDTIDDNPQETVERVISYHS